MDGFEGRFSAPDKALLATLMFGFWVLSLQWTFWRTGLMLLGRIKRAFEFRRPLSCCLNAVRSFVDARWQCVLLGCEI